MPCQGPSPDEIRAIERAALHRKIGKAWTEAEAAENVACALSKHIRHKEPIPDWANKWMDRHEEYDRVRKQAEKNRREEARERDLLEFERLKRKLGK